jgi:Flp pilus assembly protein TadD
MDGRLPRQASRSALVAAALLCALPLGCRAVSTGRNVDGVRYFQQGQYPVAIQRFDAALTIDPKNPDSYYNKGAVLHRTGIQTKDQNALNQAESLYRQCLAYNPDHVDCHRGLAVLLTETNRTNDAFTLLRNWATTSPQNSDARVELARLHEEYNDPRAAETYLTEALTLNSRDWRAHAALGRLKEQGGDLNQALVNYQRAYNLNRFQPELGQRIASLQSKAPAVPTVGGATMATGAAPLGTPRSAAAPRTFRTY